MMISKHWRILYNIVYLSSDFLVSPLKNSYKKFVRNKKHLKHQFYKDLTNSYMDPDSESTDNILFPRKIKFDGIIDSKIVNLNIGFNDYKMD